MIWWIRQPLRAEAERIAIGALAERVPWITHLSWRATDLKLAADFDLKIGERSIPLTLLYPAFFPDVTPLIISRDGVRLSAHQYGAQGELCLEHRPDNWSPDVTGAMMIESAHRLLTLESETGQTAPSEHRTTPAQHLRGEAFRFRLTSEALQGLAAIDAGQAEEIEAVEHAFAGGFTAQLSRFGTAGSPTWTEPDPRGAGASRIRGWALRLQDGSAREVTSFAELATLLEKQGFQDIVHGLREASAATFVIMFDGEKTCPVLADADTGRTFNYRVVLAESPKPRMDREYALLEDATVAVVGCGSLGSKVAAHLARAGFRKFVLVDGDLLESGNLIRNELDWRAVGLHKAPALAARLREVRAGCEVKAHSIVMAGQESGGILSNVMASIESCDVIVEATADSDVFNLCAAVARQSRKPMCWGQVFGGGAGGVVVRLRPDIDLTPHRARQRIEDFYAKEGVPWPDDGTGDRYASSADGPPLIADDADVSVIAAHVARLAIDLIARPGATIFPDSAYVIGLRQTWLFRAPFDTCPIDLSCSDPWAPEPEHGAAEALQRLVEDLFKKRVEDEG